MPEVAEQISDTVECSSTPTATFDSFASTHSTRLRRAFAARFGTDVADDLVAEVIAYGWEHWNELREVKNPVGFLYRVGVSKARRYRRWGRRVLFPFDEVRMADDRVDLFRALERLPQRQRVAVLAVRGYGWSYAETAEILNVSEAAVTNYVHRAMVRLRKEFER